MNAFVPAQELAECVIGLCVEVLVESPGIVLISRRKQHQFEDFCHVLQKFDCVGPNAERDLN